MSYLDDRKCDGCEAELSFAVRERETTFVGGYKTKVCLDCSNAWGQHVIGNGMFYGLRRLELEMGSLEISYKGTGPDLSEELNTKLQALQDSKNEMEQKLFKEAVSFLTSRKKVAVED